MTTMFVLIGTVMLATNAIGVPMSSIKPATYSRKGCEGKPAELFFLLDSSSSIWSVDFNKQLHFISELIEQFQIGPNKTRVGVGSFSYRYHSNIALDTYDSAEEIQKAVLDIPQYLGGTYTYTALDGVRTKGLGANKVRPGVAKVVVVITDGKSYNEAKTKEAALLLKKEATVFAVGIGSNTDTEELTAIASEPTKDHLFQVGNYGLLDTIKERLANSACVEAEEQNDEADKGPTCGYNKNADVMFLLEPVETGITHAQEIFQFIGEVTTEFNMITGNMQVGVASSHCGSTDVHMGEYVDSAALASAIRNTQLSRMGHMIRRLRTHSYAKANGGRDTARHMAVVFVDGKLHNAKDVIDEAKRTKHNDVELFVVAIGESVVTEELTQLCSSPSDRHIIRVPSYKHLLQARQIFLKQFCHGL